MLRPLRSELYRLRRRWMTWILLGAIVVLGLVFYELLYFSINTQLQLLRSGNAPANLSGPGGSEAAIRQFEETLQQLRPRDVSGLGVSLVAGIGAVMLIVFGASHMGTEFGWGTMRTLLASGASRSQFLASKLVSMALFAVVFTAVGIVGVLVASYVVSWQAGFDTSGLDVGKVLSVGWRTAFCFAPYLALAALIALWSRSSGAGIAVGLVIYFAEGIVTSLLISFNKDYVAIANLGLSRNVQSVARVAPSVNVGGGTAATASTLPDPVQAAAVLIVWTVLFVALAWWRLRRRDVTLA